MIENIPTPLVSFAGSGRYRIFHGDVSEKSPEIPCNSRNSRSCVLSYSMDAGASHIQGQVDWNRVGNDSIVWLQSFSVQVSSTHILGKKRHLISYSRSLVLELSFSRWTLETQNVYI